MSHSPDVLAIALQHYMTVGRRVSGRPTWANLDPNCNYDMGMRKQAIFEAIKLMAVTDTTA